MPLDRPRRGHTFGGCGTCRKRHLKCDQAVPKCKRCRVSGLGCDGFVPALKWFNVGGPEAACDKGQAWEADGGQQSARRHLYSEDSRELMSNELLQSIPRSVMSALSNIEEESRNLDTMLDHEGTYAVGPFCVLKLDSSTGSSATVTQSEVTVAASNNDPDLSQEPRSPEAQLPTPIPSGAEFNDSLMPVEASLGNLDFLHWEDLFTLDLSALEGSTLFPSPELQNTSNDASAVQNSMEWVADQALSYQSNLGTGVRPGDCDPTWLEMDLLIDAPFLLRQFDLKVIDQMGSLPINEKSAWRTLHYPCAVMTLSDLTVLGTDRSAIKYANLATFYALIAVSALHQSLNISEHSSDITQSDEHWKSLASKAYNSAKHVIRLSLEKECKAPRKAKYKEQLMGISATLAFALLSGNQPDARWCLTEMERMISWRGLPKPLTSRRARLLHNIYAWMRIVSESTYVLHDLPIAEVTPVRYNFEGSGGFTAQAGRHKRLPIDRDVVLDNFLQPQPREIHSLPSNENSKGRDIQEIHLADSMDDRDNMYMQIYGVPETWLRLVSQITRLANVLDRISAKKEVDAETLLAVQPRVSELEGAVCLFRSRHETDGDKSSSTPHAHMVRALSSALVIFFYRRCRSIHPLVLQDSVDKVIEYLDAFDKSLERSGLLGPGTAWPAFIAGAEAMSEKQQRSIAGWLDRGVAKSGFESYRASREVLTEVWRRNGIGQGGKFATWMVVCHDMGKWPLLS